MRLSAIVLIAGNLVAAGADFVFTAMEPSGAGIARREFYQVV
jgi:hypothetical protein